ncbi:MAG: polyprenyl synthetase family protein [Fimbriimonadaceae bacterium]|nr:polyprenyl synthetase family protein [Fimbriimonadaceae bacterium]
MSADPALKSYASMVDSRLDALLPPETQRPSELHRAMRYSCLAPGKRLRPALCMASAGAVGGDPTAALDAGCAVEMLHCFSLIHDDLPAIDNDDLRRGRPTCHRVYGEALAILAGDALFARSLEVLAGIAAQDSVRVRSVSLLTRAAGSDGLVGGEVLDVLSEGRDVDAETLRFIHSRKTGALIAAACQIGGLLGGGSEAQVQALGAFATDIGLAFQIADDLLNVLSTADALGKSTGSDRERAKATYPALYGVQRSREIADEAVVRAIAALDPLPDNPSREALRTLARFAVERDS